MKLKHQLWVVFGGMLFQVLLLGVLGCWSLGTMQQRAEEMSSAARKVQLSLVIPGILNLNRERAIKTLFLDDADEIRALDLERVRTVGLNDVYLKELEESVKDDAGIALLHQMRDNRKIYLDSLAEFVKKSKGANRQTLMATVDKELGAKVKAYQDAYDAMTVF